MHQPQTGFVIWFTGLSGAGKSTLSHRVGEELQRRLAHVEVLDGDEVRTHLSKGLGFTREDRDTNVLRIGFVSKLLARHGVAVLVAAIAPYADTRQRVRQGIERFVEVHVDCPLEELEARDVKGLYARARRGELEHFTGISDPYEAPASPEIRVDTSRHSPDESVAMILRWLEQHECIPAVRDAALADR
ncbi:MAG: adenylyl-sulfate kinase [Dehalococcoidia bacterium]|nr:adenylyl-sulfate kinase [Dehalococcoidia bacterium]